MVKMGGECDTNVFVLFKHYYFSSSILGLGNDWWGYPNCLIMDRDASPISGRLEND